MGRRRWRNSLYARAALFLALGSASLVGAVAALSTTTVEESVQRLLEERLDLARTVGVLLEHRLAVDLARIGDAVATQLEQQGRGPGPAAALAREHRRTIFREGAFVLDAEGALVASVPFLPNVLAAATDLDALAQRARERRTVVSSPLVSLGPGPRQVLLLLRPLHDLDGQLIGHAGGVLAPASHNLLDALSEPRRDTETALGLVDAQGTLVASTDRRQLFRAGDHDSVLTEAIRGRRELGGRCHSCHERENEVLRDTEVLAFAPLPTLDLGVAVHQPERIALAPAFALRRQLLGLGLSFVSLFLLFAGLSVRSVVHPVTRLTRAVREQEDEGGRLYLPRFGSDEVGTLARTLERWRAGLMDSMDAAEQHRQALHSEIEATRRHLDALQDVATQVTLGSDAQEIVEHGLDRMLSVLGFSTGALRIRFEERELTARRHLDAESAARLLGRAAQQLTRRAPELVAGGFAVRQNGALGLAPPASERGPLFSVVAASHLAPGGLELVCVLGDEQPRAAVEERWVQSLVHHVGISVTNRLLREKDLERQHLQAEYLRRLLKAQEDERRRVARELHDTVSQDLAALRLEIERLGRRATEEPVRARLAELEERAHGMLVAVRQTLLDLRLSVLETMGFLPAIQWHLERLGRERGVRGTLSVDGEESTLDYELAVTLFRILQEALQNVVQHAGAGHVFVTVSFEADRVELTVEDDGRGFDPDRVRAGSPEEQGRGLGLLGMEERARLLSGHFEIHSREGEGTMVRVSVPLPAATSRETA